ncbi:putative homing endonuclease [Pseudomonas phage nickie]|uniref:Putative homing endonuclease n=1 Tax=Pseudomonas phage nickie TaxID=2048977 RepID=A0A2H4P763_9CAUD|nr:HNH endonuclease [Pseudomonas phage nickie]ATW58009.1 putative homing endonuclease [Pseudomonas phage nickie]
MKEEWRFIPGHSSYEVSNMGRVRSHKRLDSRGQPKLLSLSMTVEKPTKPRYWKVGLKPDVGQRRTMEVHRLVLITFVGPPPTIKHQGAHNDGNGLNNWLPNLKWATQAENEADKILHGTVAQGASHGKAVLTEAQVRRIKKVKKWKHGMVRAFAIEFGVQDSAISKIKLGQRWNSL